MLDVIAIVGFLGLCLFVFWYLYRNGGSCKRCGFRLVLVTKRSALEKDRDYPALVAWESIHVCCLSPWCLHKRVIRYPRPRLRAKHLLRVLNAGALRETTSS